jgi:hypothetical protein
MKKIAILSLFIISVQGLTAQINLSHPPVVDITNSNVFLDASKNFSSAAGAANNVGKGLVVPSVDLVNFQFNADFLSSTEAPSFYDGMLVYNSAIGTTLTTGNRSSSATAVTPGFYYFSNPSGATNENITGGEWKPLGSGASGSVKDITATEVVLDKKIDGAQLYAIKGTFTASGTSAAVTITKPTGMTGYYSLTTYKDGKTFRNQIISFDTVATTDNVVTGNGFMTEAYPAGSYNYVLEYFK